MNGTFTQRRTEADYMGALLDAVPLEDWRDVVTATVPSAKAGDSAARAWLTQYLIGKPGATAPAPLTIVVEQLAGRVPLVEQLAKPHLDRVAYPSKQADDDQKDALKAQVAAELRVLEAQQSNTANGAEDTEETPGLERLRAL